MRGYDPATIAALNSQNVKWLVLVKVDFDSGTLAFCSSFKEYEYDGVSYIGAGTLGSVSSTTENPNLDPADYTISLSGVRDATMSAILNEDYLNRKAQCLVAALDDNDEIIGVPMVYFRGLIDSIEGVYSSAPEIRITVKNRLAEWNKSRISRYTNQEQLARYPGDKGFEYVAEIASKQVTWPARTWYENNQ